MLQNMIGKAFEAYTCDEFHFRPAVYQAVYFRVNNKTYSVENTLHNLDYFGSKEDVGVLRVRPCTDECASRVSKGIQVNTPIERIVKRIKIVNDTYRMTENNLSDYEISFTKALIFCFEDRQVVFEKDVWFSEDIFVYRGTRAEEKIKPVDDDKPEDYGEVKFESIREIVAL